MAGSSHLARSFQDSHVLLCVCQYFISFFFFFFWPNNTPLYGYTTFTSIHQLIDICVVSTFLALLNNVVVNIGVQFLCGHVFSSLKCTPRSEIVGSYGNSVFNILRNCQTFAQKACIILHSYQWWMRIPISSCPVLHLLMFVLFIIDIVIQWSDISLWFWFAFPWWLRMLNIFLSLSLTIWRMSSQMHCAFLSYLPFYYCFRSVF